MKTINLRTESGVKITRFPDKQPHVQVIGIEEHDSVRVICSLNSPSAVLELLMCSNALDNIGCKKLNLVILYLLGARYDRIMNYGDSLDLKVIADIINMCNFESVAIFDPHNPGKTLDMIKNSFSYSSLDTTKYPKGFVAIVPDKGAAERAGDFGDSCGDIVYCDKIRDANGKITLKVISPEKCENKFCVIFDDLCDGGMTFVKISEQINPSELHLYVSHAIFSHGLEDLRRHFTSVKTTNSYADWTENDFLKVRDITNGF